MRNFKEEWDLIFTQMLRSIDTFGNNTVSATYTYGIYLNKTNIVSGSYTIIDYIIILCRNLDAILIYLEFVCKAFLKYWVRFRFKKCDFLKNRVEYVVHDVTKAGNCHTKKIRPHQQLEHNPNREILILLHWDSEFIPFLWSLFWYTIEAIAEIY